MPDFNYPGSQNQSDSGHQNQGSFPKMPTTSIEYDDEEKDDLIRFQLDLSTTKSDISHWLNGDIPNGEKKGKTIWKINKNKDYRNLNEFGIREVMRILNIYLTKDVIMSNLKEEKINEICEQIGYELNDLFFTKYDQIGLFDDNRKKNYSSIIIPLLHIIYITLMRAKDGKERQSVTENKVVNQAELSYPGMGRGGFSLNPKNWGRR